MRSLHRAQPVGLIPFRPERLPFRVPPTHSASTRSSSPRSATDLFSKPLEERAGHRSAEVHRLRRTRREMPDSNAGKCDDLSRGLVRRGSGAKYSIPTKRPRLRKRRSLFLRMPCRGAAARQRARRHRRSHRQNSCATRDSTYADTSNSGSESRMPIRQLHPLDAHSWQNRREGSQHCSDS